MKKLEEMNEEEIRGIFEVMHPVNAICLLKGIIFNKNTLIEFLKEIKYWYRFKDNAKDDYENIKEIFKKLKKNFPDSHSKEMEKYISPIHLLEKLINDDIALNNFLYNLKKLDYKKDPILTVFCVSKAYSFRKEIVGMEEILFEKIKGFSNKDFIIFIRNCSDFDGPLPSILLDRINSLTDAESYLFYDKYANCSNRIDLLKQLRPEMLDMFNFIKYPKNDYCTVANAKHIEEYVDYISELEKLDSKHIGLFFRYFFNNYHECFKIRSDSEIQILEKKINELSINGMATLAKVFSDNKFNVPDNILKILIDNNIIIKVLENGELTLNKNINWNDIDKYLDGCVDLDSDYTPIIFSEPYFDELNVFAEFKVEDLYDSFYKKIESAYKKLEKEYYYNLKCIEQTSKFIKLSDLAFVMYVNSINFRNGFNFNNDKYKEYFRYLIIKKIELLESDFLDMLTIGNGGEFDDAILKSKFRVDFENSMINDEYKKKSTV